MDTIQDSETAERVEAGPSRPSFEHMEIEAPLVEETPDTAEDDEERSTANDASIGILREALAGFWKKKKKAVSFEHMEIEAPLVEETPDDEDEEEPASNYNTASLVLRGALVSLWKNHKKAASAAGAVLLLLMGGTLLAASLELPGDRGSSPRKPDVSAAKINSSDYHAYRKYHTEEYLISNNISRQEDLWREGSPQERALRFLLTLPVEDLESPDEFLAKYVLAVVYYSTQGDRWTSNRAFLQKGPVCNWKWNQIDPTGKITRFGVVCDQQQRIINLSMGRNNLDGPLPRELGLLTTLKFVDFNFNALTGTIPETFQSLAGLMALDLMDNRISGGIPSWIGALQNLTAINFSNNRMTGRLPTGLGTLENLGIIAIDNNLFTGSLAGLYDDSLGLLKLQRFYADNNRFGGPLDDTFLEHANGLLHLDISNNYFIGSIPRHLFEYRGLQVLDLHDNHFSAMPQDFPENTNLEMLALQKCKLAQQEIPSSIANLKALKHLDLSQNSFTGTIPSTIGEMKNLTYLYLAQNEFEAGPIPDWIESLSGLLELDLKSTKRTGTIPSFLGSLNDLILLDLDNNLLEGEIPSSLGDLQHVNIMLLNRNNLTSTIPDSFKKLQQLKLLFLDANTNITGSFGDNFCNKTFFPLKPVIVAGCDVCNEIDDCCQDCCEPGEECNPGTFVPDMDPIWQLGYRRVFFTVGRDDFLEHNRKNMTGNEGIKDWFQHSSIFKKYEGAS